MSVLQITNMEKVTASALNFQGIGEVGACFRGEVRSYVKLNLSESAII